MRTCHRRRFDHRQRLLLAAGLVVAIIAAQRAAAAPPSAPTPRVTDSAPSTLPAVLTLFDLDLRDVSPAALRAALLKAGAKATKAKSASGSGTFNVSAIGLPGILTLDVVFDQGNFVLASYASGSGFDASRAGEEKLRKMVLEKYGEPVFCESQSFGRTSKVPYKQCAGSYGFEKIATYDTRYIWEFAGGMQLVYQQKFFHDFFLTYLNPTRFAALNDAAKNADTDEVRKQTHEKRNAF